MIFRTLFTATLITTKVGQPYFDTLFLHRSPFSHQLVVGDFNSNPWSSAFKKLQTESRLKNSANGFAYIASWSISQQPILSWLSSAYIDHTLISDAFTVFNKQAQPIQGSDHQLIVTELML